VARPVRLETSVELKTSDPLEASVSALLEAVLDDGSRVTLLDDRGWSSAMYRSDGHATTRIVGPEAWAAETADEIAREARVVVGPDEPFGAETHASMTASHWAHLAGILEAEGIAADPDELRRLPHEVVIGERLLAKLRTSG
jgi:hypothetical protein